MKGFIEIPTRFFSQSYEKWYDSGTNVVNVKNISRFTEGTIYLIEICADGSQMVLYTEKTLSQIKELIKQATI